jgi:1-acyl-sn-glycerol-3-phosphate acyltransferase
VIEAVIGVGVLALLVVLVYVGLKFNGAEWNSWLANVLDGWIRIFCRRYHRLKGDLIDLPASGGAIVVANHVSGLDPFILIASCSRPLRFMIAKEEYNRFGLKWMFKIAGCIPVDRSGRVDKAFREVIRKVNQGEVVAMFPHGRIYLDNEDKAKIKAGLRKLAVRLSCNVYPARIEGVKGQGDVFTGVIRRGNVTLTSYDPISHTQFNDDHIDELLGALLLGRMSYKAFKQQLQQSLMSSDVTSS